MEFRRKIALWLCPELSGCCAEAAQDEPQLTRHVQGAEALITNAPLTELDLVRLGKAYASFQGGSLSTLALYICGDGNFFKRLSSGKTCTIRRANSIICWFSDNWPDLELEWPSDIPRPQNPLKTGELRDG